MSTERHVDFMGSQSNYSIVKDLFFFINMCLQFTSESKSEMENLLN